MQSLCLFLCGGGSAALCGIEMYKITDHFPGDHQSGTAGDEGDGAGRLPPRILGFWGVGAERQLFGIDDLQPGDAALPRRWKA